MTSHPFRRARAARAARAAEALAERDWLDVPLVEISTELLELARSTAERQLASHEALNGRLTTTITFAGALLAVALTLGQKAGAVHLHHSSRTFFGIGFVVAVLLLTGTIALAIWALQPERRPRANPSLLKHYGTVSTSPDEVVQDAYRFEVALATRLGALGTAGGRLACCGLRGFLDWLSSLPPPTRSYPFSR